MTPKMFSAHYFDLWRHRKFVSKCPVVDPLCCCMVGFRYPCAKPMCRAFFLVGVFDVRLLVPGQRKYAEVVVRLSSCRQDAKLHCRPKAAYSFSTKQSRKNLLIHRIFPPLCHWFGAANTDH